MARAAIHKCRSRRRGFSLLELLMAASFTAAACSAATLLIKSINDAAATSNGIYAGTAAARNGIACIDLLVEQAALIGHWDNDRILIWRHDDNGDGQINVLELTLVHHKAATHELSLQEVRFPSGTPAAVVNAQNQAVPLSQFAALEGAQQVELHANVAVRRLVGEITQFAAWCNATQAGAEMAQLNFTVTSRDGSQAFHAVMSLRGRTRQIVP